MCFETATKLFTHNKDAMTMSSQAGFDFGCETRHRIDKCLSALRYIIVYLSHKVWIDEPQAEPIVATVSQRVHVRRTRYQCIDPGWKREFLNRSGCESNACAECGCEALVAAPHFRKQPRAQLTIRVHIGEFRLRIFFVP